MATCFGVQVKAAANAVRRSYSRPAGFGMNRASESGGGDGAEDIQPEALLQLLAQLTKQTQPGV